MAFLICNLQLEVGPSSFTKLRMLGKGDVGKVYLVREKKTEKLCAMKGAQPTHGHYFPDSIISI